MSYIIRETLHTTVSKIGGAPTAGYRVWFEIPETNTQDYIELEDAKYTPANVRAAIEPKVKANLELFGLEEEI